MFVEDDGLVHAAAAIELLHMATLVHDDVVDEAPARRGQPTVFAQAGRGAATATGDFLFSRPLSVLALNDSQRQLQELADASVALSQGEFAQRHDAYATDVTLERYLHRCDLKTARLFSAACALGALAASRGEDEVAALSGYGRKVGLAFQMLDDVLDVSGPIERTGKRRGGDLLEGTTTLPLILAKQADPFLRDFDLHEVQDADRAELVCDRIAASGSLDRARSQAVELVSEAKRDVATTVDARLRNALDLVADGIVERYA